MKKSNLLNLGVFSAGRILTLIGIVVAATTAVRAYSGYSAYSHYNSNGAGSINRRPISNPAQRDQNNKMLLMGMCVGQALYKQGILLPNPMPKPSDLDQTTLDAIKAAMKDCRASNAASPSPAPSAAPSSPGPSSSLTS